MLVRKFEVLGRSHGIPSKKGDLEASQLPGSGTLICAAFDCRTSPVKLKEVPLMAVSATGAAIRGIRATPMVTQVHARGDYSYLRINVTIEFTRLVKMAYDPFDVTTLDVTTLNQSFA